MEGKMLSQLLSILMNAREQPGLDGDNEERREKVGELVTPGP